MKITRTSNEIADIVNETVGMDICRVDPDGNVEVCILNDAEGNRIDFCDYIFCSGMFYHYINQYGFEDDRPDFKFNSYPVNDELDCDCKCFNRDGEHSDFCDHSVNDDETDVWTFDEETFVTVLEGLKTVLKVNKAQQLVILDDEEEFAV